MWGCWNCAECWAQQPCASPRPSNFPLPLMYTPHSCAPLSPTGVLSSRKAPHQLHRPTVVSPSQSLGWSPVTSHSWTGLKYSRSILLSSSKDGLSRWGAFSGSVFPSLSVGLHLLFVCLLVCLIQLPKSENVTFPVSILLSSWETFNSHLAM